MHPRPCCRLLQVPVEYVLGVGGFDLEKVEEEVGLGVAGWVGGWVAGRASGGQARWRVGELAAGRAGGPAGSWVGGRQRPFQSLSELQKPVVSSCLTRVPAGPGRVCCVSWHGPAAKAIAGGTAGSIVRAPRPGHSCRQQPPRVPGPEALRAVPALLRFARCLRRSWRGPAPMTTSTTSAAPAAPTTLTTTATRMSTRMTMTHPAPPATTTIMRMSTRMGTPTPTATATTITTMQSMMML